MIVLSGLAAIVFGLAIQDYRRRVTRTYYHSYPVADLIRPPLTLDALAAEVRASAPRDGWFRVDRQVESFPGSISLIVRDTKAGHRLVRSDISRRRALLGLPEPTEIHTVAGPIDPQALEGAE